jgi:ubiquinone/menaquinone biosynthesis C-methylase UbiE
VEFHEASAEALPLADASFDRYAANFVLCVSSRPTDLLSDGCCV